MTEETAKALAEAMNRLAAAIESIRSPGSIGGGIQVYHHGMHPIQPHYGAYWGGQRHYGGAS